MDTRTAIYGFLQSRQPFSLLSGGPAVLREKGGPRFPKSQGNGTSSRRTLFGEVALRGYAISQAVGSRSIHFIYSTGCLLHPCLVLFVRPFLADFSQGRRSQDQRPRDSPCLSNLNSRKLVSPSMILLSCKKTLLRTRRAALNRGTSSPERQPSNPPHLVLRRRFMSLTRTMLGPSVTATKLPEL